MIYGFTCGAFDLCHAGHMLMFKECKEHCDYLIVGLHSDPTIDRPEKNKPVMSVEERGIILAGIKYINEIWLYHTESDLRSMLSRIFLKDGVVPEGISGVRFIGEDWKGKPFTGHDLPIKIHYTSRNYHGYSTSELRNRVIKAEFERRGYGQITS